MLEFSIARSQVFALGPRCCIISTSMSSIPAAFPGFSMLIAASSSSRSKGLVRALAGCGRSDTAVRRYSPVCLRRFWLRPFATSCAATEFAVTVVGVGGVVWSSPRRRIVAHAFLLLLVILVFSISSFQTCLRSSPTLFNRISPRGIPCGRCSVDRWMFPTTQGYTQSGILLVCVVWLTFSAVL